MKSPVRVLLVGGSALLGGHVVTALLREDALVSIAVMDLRPYQGPHADRVETLRGDVTSAEDCARILAGSQPYDVVISMVTPDLMRGTAEAFQRVNVDGIHNLLAACQNHGVRGLVYISSIAVLDHFRDHVDVDETEPLPPLEQYRSPYDRSKRLGEDAVLAADRPGGLRTCSLRMGGILSDMRDVALRYLTKPVVVIQGHGRPIDMIDMIDGFNAAHAIVLAVRAILERADEVGGEAFFITKGRAVTTWEYFPGSPIGSAIA